MLFTEFYGNFCIVDVTSPPFLTPKTWATSHKTSCILKTQMRYRDRLFPEGTQPEVRVPNTNSSGGRGSVHSAPVLSGHRACTRPHQAGPRRPWPEALLTGGRLSRGAVRERRCRGGAGTHAQTAPRCPEPNLAVPAVLSFWRLRGGPHSGRLVGKRQASEPSGTNVWSRRHGSIRGNEFRSLNDWTVQFNSSTNFSLKILNKNLRI